MESSLPLLCHLQKSPATPKANHVPAAKIKAESEVTPSTLTKAKLTTTSTPKSGASDNTNDTSSDRKEATTVVS